MWKSKQEKQRYIQGKIKGYKSTGEFLKTQSQEIGDRINIVIETGVLVKKQF